ncbi:hypothetical protein SAMN05444159_3361 [Bradyrhizobium lablabi]|uniref:Uncharacterized protein n=1 Tax=Bradyrhizobium lablabi TaxID=722472 RepID=A0A1M6STQ6_9BRAD|nr:hypothetical protein [Bradyrhizobium lablabi]SHK48046.1 hypothetical protein SAMN05444159_3361 [Bradyrhizobium lablabi]
MFKTLAKSGLKGFWPVQPRRIAPVPHEVGLSNATHSNDNLPGLRRPKGRRRIPSPALACHWIDRNGRLECRWQVVHGGDAPIGDFDEHGATGRASGTPPLMSSRGRRLAPAG